MPSNYNEDTGMIETIRDGKPATPFMQFGDRIRLEVLDAAGHSVFGAIDQQFVQYRQD